MRILVSPPMRFGKDFTGAARRTLEIYSRIGEEVYLCVDSNTLQYVDEEIKPLLSSLKLVKSDSTSGGFGYIIRGFLNCLSQARKVDVILSYSEYSLSVIYSYFLSLFSGKPLIIFVHHVTEELRGNSKYSFLLKRAFKRSKGIICLDNPEVKEELEKMFGKGKKIVTSTNGVNVDQYYTSDEKMCDGLFIGDYGERKGVKYLREIWNLVNEKGNFKLCILGRKWEGKELPKNSVYLGFVPEREKRDILAKSKVFVFPSVYEGFSLVVAEALASYLPVITWDLSWNKRFERGIIKVKFADTSSFAEKILFLLMNEKIRKKLGFEGKEFAKNLSWEKASEIEKKALIELLS
ncbi:glycosyltransferase family 4 protein [Sulfolobus tengchongensis]|uniref:Glycosyltransferase family 4 protein n=1 Tax=Sulfolobus tengchongensis TaxID=207809 RepID=A0AAX4KY02_9CREN